MEASAFSTALLALVHATQALDKLADKRLVAYGGPWVFACGTLNWPPPWSAAPPLRFRPDDEDDDADTPSKREEPPPLRRGPPAESQGDEFAGGLREHRVATG